MDVRKGFTRALVANANASELVHRNWSRPSTVAADTHLTLTANCRQRYSCSEPGERSARRSGAPPHRNARRRCWPLGRRDEPAGEIIHINLLGELAAPTTPWTKSTGTCSPCRWTCSGNPG